MNNTLYSFFNKGRVNFTKILPAAISSIAKLEIRRIQNVQCILVALKNGEIRLYNDKYHIDTIEMGESILGMVFGNFGREEGCLVINTESGGIHTKVL
jgi:Bardet-Biedl syndrome 1 protein